MTYIIAKPVVKIVGRDNSEEIEKLVIDVLFGNYGAASHTIYKNYVRVDGASGNLNYPLGKIRDLSGSVFEITTSITDINPIGDVIEIEAFLDGPITEDIPTEPYIVKDGDVVIYSITIIFQG